MRLTLRPWHARLAHADAKRTWSERGGVVLAIEDGGVVGLGEASPLPGYSRDDLATCRAELERACERSLSIDAAMPIDAILADAVARAGVSAPAACFAVETAALDFVAKARGEPAWRVLRGDDGAQPVPLSAIAEGDDAAALASAAERAALRGIRVIKVKVGGERAVARDVPRLTAVRSRIGGDVRLRLDANQALSADELAPALDAYARFGVELIEEPATPALVAALGASPIPIALDESLADDDFRGRLATCAAVVLKPMALGGLRRCLALADAAHAVGAAAIVTHLFDGPIAAASAACLALAVRGRVLPCGLDVHERLGGAVLAIGVTHIAPIDVPGIGVRDDGANR